MNENLKSSLDLVLKFFLTAFIGFIYNEYSNKSDEIVVYFILGIILIIYILLERKIDMISGNQRRLSREVLGLKPGFILVKGDELNSMTFDALKGYSVIRVIGNGRQDFIEVSGDEGRAVQKYYDIILKPLKIKQNGNSAKKVYKRIIPRELKSKFRNHIVDSLTYAKDNDHQVEIVINDNFSSSYTYLIINDKLMILSVENISHIGFPDNTLDMYTTNSTVIKEYIRHFDRIFESKKHITSSDDLIQELDNNRNIVENLNSIIHDFNGIPNTSTANHHAALEIEQTKKRVEGLASRNLIIDHKVANGKLLKILASYMSLHLEGDIYRTISFYEFWTDVIKADKQELFKANKDIVSQGVIVNRIFVVRNSWIDQHYDDGIKINEWFDLFQILLEHCILKNKTSNYHFKILFKNDNDYDNLYKLYLNFVLMHFKSINESVLLIPNTKNQLDKNIGHTNIKFYKGGNSDTDLDDYKNGFKSILQEQEAQKFTNNQNRFLTDLGYF